MSDINTFINGFPVGETLLCGHDPLLLQVTSTPFYYRPVSYETNLFGADNWFYYARQRDITAQASIYRYDINTLTAELVEDGRMLDAAPDTDCVYDDGSIITEGPGKTFIIKTRGQTINVYHGNNRGPAPETRAHAYLSPDRSWLLYFSNCYGLRHIFLMQFPKGG